MTREEQLKIYEEVNSKLTNLSKSKGEDYAGEDVLSNFKNLADACKALQIDITNPVGVSLFFQLHKIARIANLLKDGKTPNNEGLEDSFIDLIGYTMLSYCNYFDETKCCGNWDSDGVCRPECNKVVKSKSFEALKNLKGIDKEPDTVNGVLNEVVTGKIDTLADKELQQLIERVRYDKTKNNLKPFYMILEDKESLYKIYTYIEPLDNPDNINPSLFNNGYTLGLLNKKSQKALWFDISKDGLYDRGGTMIEKEFIESLGYKLD